MSEGTESVETVAATAARVEYASFTWTETRTYSSVAVPMLVVAELLAEHAPAMLTDALSTLLSDNADDEDLRPVFAALADHAAASDVEVTEVCDASAEY